MNQPNLLWVVLMCFGFSLVYAAAQTQPAASPPASAPTTPPPPGETGTAAATTPPIVATPLPDPQTPQEFFARARALSDLTAAGVPFHLKATYVASGDAEFTGNGRYEEWWQSKDLWRKEATLGDYKYVEIENGDKQTVYASSDYVPLRLRQAMDAIEIETALNQDVAKKWQTEKKVVSGVELTVISAKYPIGMFGPYQASRADYFTSKGILRISQATGVLTLYNNWRPFQKLVVPRSIQVISGKDRILDISVDLLEPLNSEDEASLSLVPQGMNAAVFYYGGPGLVAPRLEYRPLPENPTGVSRGEKPTVLIGATIDQNGNLREVYIEESAGSFLDHAALRAFRQFRFKPATLNGSPIDIQISFPYIFVNQSTP